MSAPGPVAAASAADVVLLARQPILRTGGAIHGYELLFRREDGSGWPIGDEDQATARVLVAAFADVGLAAVTSGTKAWVNTPRGFLLDTDLSVLPAERVVLELLERDAVDGALVARAQELARAGFELALDDFAWREDTIPLLDLATYVKLDIRELGLDGVAEHVRRLGAWDVQVVAEKVETADERDACRALGVELFQGYFFERPRLVRGRPAPQAALSRLRNATALSRESTFEEIGRIVRLDAGLSVRLLRYINSAAVGVRHRVTSLRQALMLVGTKALRQWLLLALMGDLGSGRPAVLSAALVRAKLCETLARDAGLDATDSAFSVGLLSVCDALLDAPLDEVICGLPLAPEIRDAIVRREGPLGALLETAIALEHGEAASDAGPGHPLHAAVCWADEQLEGIAAA